MAGLRAEKAGGLIDRDSVCEYLTFLKNGQARPSASKPTIGLGRLRLELNDGSAQVIGMDQVDLERTKKSWSNTDSMRAVDRSEWLNRALPATVPLRPGSADDHSYTIVYIWSTYCLACRADLTFLEGYLDKTERPAFAVQSICLGSDKALYRSLVRHWAGMDHAYLEREQSEALVRDLGLSGPESFVLDSRGTVRASSLHGYSLTVAVEALAHGRPVPACASNPTSEGD